MKNIFSVLFLFVLLTNSFGSFAQTKTFTDEARSRYILDIVSQVTWPNEGSITEYNLGIIEKDKSLFDALNTEAAKRITVHGKPIKIVHLNSLDEADNIQVLYFEKHETKTDIYLASNKIAGKKILLITENYEYHTSMINFIVDPKGIKRYEINEKKVTAEGFVLPALFLAGSVKNKTDWEELYERTEKLLEAEKQVVEQQSKQIEQQKAEIEKQMKEIAEQTKRIEVQREEIKKQQAMIDVQRMELTRLINDVNQKQEELAAKTKELDEKSAELERKTKELDEKTAKLEKQTKEIKVQEAFLEKQKAEIKKQESELSHLIDKVNTQNLIIYLFVFLSLVMAGLGYFIYRSYKIKKKANKLLNEKNIAIMEQNEEIRQQKEEIETQRDAIEIQRDQIIEQKEEIMDSIVYAQRIQRAILPPEDYIGRNLDSYFILNKPRDIVSGDYYWFTEYEDSVIVAAADCTGHGVPGAFMSMLGVAFLNEIVNKGTKHSANEILNLLRAQVIKALRQTGKEGEAKDGMDIAMVVIEKNGKSIQYAGANNPMYLVRLKDSPVIEDAKTVENDTHILYEIKADKMPIGIYGEEIVSFTNKEIELVKGDSIYVFSDGYADQFGGPRGKKFMYKTFKELLLEIQPRGMHEQFKILDETIENWKAHHDPVQNNDHFEQIDDILVIGVRMD
ncbi:MAG: DUF4154 domain-containing protein [Bacteroidales bacterium]|nr:DUF4154 domain-containing protein [Bacteroidales bacterium]